MWVSRWGGGRGSYLLTVLVAAHPRPETIRVDQK